MYFEIYVFLAVVLLMAYLMPEVRRLKERYEFAQQVPGPSFLEMRELAKCRCRSLIYFRLL